MRRTHLLTVALLSTSLLGCGISSAPAAATDTETTSNIVVRTATGAIVVTKAPAKKTWPKAFPKGLKACENEDGPGPCKWNAGTMGNGVGNSFWIDAAACFHYLGKKADRKWGDHTTPCADPYELDKTPRERECQDAAAEGDPSRMNKRFAECTAKYGK